MYTYGRRSSMLNVDNLEFIKVKNKKLSVRMSIYIDEDEKRRKIYWIKTKV